MPFRTEQLRQRLSLLAPVAMAIMLSLSGCFAPLRSHGIPACQLPDSFRKPVNRYMPEINIGSLVSPPPAEYLLGPGDVLEVIIPDLFGETSFRPLRTHVQDNGFIQLPRVGSLYVGGYSLQAAQAAINNTLANGILVAPTASVTLLEKGTVNVLVLGEVNEPGIHALTRYENDIAHAVAAAGGFTVDAADEIEIHRRQRTPAIDPHINLPPQNNFNQNRMIQQTGYQPAQRKPVSQIRNLGHSENSSRSRPNISPMSSSYRSGKPRANFGHSFDAHVPVANQVLPAQYSPPVPQVNTPQFNAPVQPGPTLRIPLRGYGITALDTKQTVLNPGDVIVIPQAVQKVFYVVGKLSEQNRTRFSLDARNREIGNGFLLPKDRDIDVVTAVAMAGYIDPIDSPTTVTVHRHQHNGESLLIHVDLIAARYDKQETILVQPGDIIYLNPDYNWWFRRTFNSSLERALGIAGGFWLTN